MRTQGIYYTDCHRVDLREFDLADPGRDQVQIEVAASGLCAWDLHLFEGLLPKGTMHPFLHGHEAAGVVTRVGEDVTQLQEGDKVAAMGSGLLANHGNVFADRCARLSDDVTHFEHWIAEPVACVLNGMGWCQLEPADRVAIVGTGFMGLLFVQGLRYSLAREVIAIDIDPVRLALAKRLGADRTINPITQEGMAALDELAQNPVDVSIECAGNQAGFDLAYRILRQGGRFNLFASHRGEPRNVDLQGWHNKGFRVYASSPSIDPDFARFLHRAIPLMEKGVFDLVPLVTHVWPPTEAQALFETAMARQTGYIKGAIAW